MAASKDTASARRSVTTHSGSVSRGL
jgi:hypothetical protein